MYKTQRKNIRSLATILITSLNALRTVQHKERKKAGISVLEKLYALRV